MIVTAICISIWGLFKYFVVVYLSQIVHQVINDNFNSNNKTNNYTVIFLDGTPRKDRNTKNLSIKVVLLKFDPSAKTGYYS